VWKGLEGATEKELARPPTAVGKLCTIMVREDNELAWELYGSSGRSVAARTASVWHGNEYKTSIEISIHDFFAGCLEPMK